MTSCWGGNDPTAIGALAALQANGLNDGVLIYGIDGSPDGKALIEEGLLTGTSTQSPTEIGTTAAEMLYEYLDGKTIEQEIMTPVTLITRQNLSEYSLTEWQ